MKVKALKNHYFESVYVHAGQTYMCDKVHGGMVVRNGICEEVTLPKKREKKVVPNKKTKLETKK